jgi:hypothetical protein
VVKWQGREDNHLPPTSGEVKNGGAIPPLPHVSSLRSASLITHRDNFIFIFTYQFRHGNEVLNYL